MEKCKDCEALYTSTSNRQLYCLDCKNKKHKERCKSYYKKTYVKKGYSQFRENNNNWKGGIGIYRELVDRTKCSFCSSVINLLVHHKDENRYNNEKSNLLVLCKRCHQVKHKCWEVLPIGSELSELKKAQASKAERDVHGKFTKKIYKV